MPLTERGRALPVPLIDLLAESGLCKSKSMARKDLKGGGIYVNNNRIVKEDTLLSEDDLLFEQYILLRKGKKKLPFTPVCGVNSVAPAAIRRKWTLSILDRLIENSEPEEEPEAPPKAAPSGESPSGKEPAGEKPSLLLKKKDPEEGEPSEEEKPSEVYDPLALTEPRQIEDLGVRKDFLLPHVLKTCFVLDTFTITEAADQLCLSMKITADLLEEWKELKCVEILSAQGYQASTRRYGMTSEGRRRAREYMRLNGYIGPVPVPISAYQVMVKKQTVLGVKVNTESLQKALSHLVVSDKLFKPLGPAVNSGRTIFLYGPPGNGKTAIAVALSSLLGGLVGIPKAVEIDGFVMRLFDPSVHQIEGEQPGDKRWSRCKCPIVVVGGELTIEMMELRMDANSNTYEAPPHVKSNNGIFILDDFGRQLVRPRDLLNRWIVPLENRVDYLTLHTGNKIELPFDQLVIFSTNINPKDLLDDAFMRRLRHKVYIGPLSLSEFKEAFEMACVSKKVPFDGNVFDTVIKDIYEPRQLPFNGCHPRDLLDHLIDLAKFEEKSPEMTQDLLLRACESYFVQIEDDDSNFATSASVSDQLK